MNGKNDTSVKLLPKTQAADPDREEPGPGTSRAVMLSNTGIALVVAALLAFVLLPRVPLLEQEAARGGGVGGRLQRGYQRRSSRTGGRACVGEQVPGIAEM